MIKLIALVLLVLPVQFAVAQTDVADSAFDTFKSLQGHWNLTSEGKVLAIQMTYEVGSKGSIVTEQFGKELSVFYRDGHDLLMTHFCNANNQPRLRMKSIADPKTLEFELFDITNLKSPATAHVQTVIYRIGSADKIGLEIHWTDGTKRWSEIYTLDRQAS